MTRKKNYSTTVLSAALVLSSTNIGYAKTNVKESNLQGIYFSDSKENAEKEEDVPIKDYGCSDEINAILSQIENKLNQYKITSEIFLLNEIMDLFSDIVKVSKGDDVNLFEEGSVLDTFFIIIRDKIYSIEDEKLAGEMLYEFAEKMLFDWRTNKEMYPYMDYFLTDGIVSFNVGRIDWVQSKLYYIQNAYLEILNSDEEDGEYDELPEIKPPVEEYPEYIPPEIDSGEILPPNNNEDDDLVDKLEKDDIITVNTYYKKVGNSCTLVERRYKQGYIFEQTSKPVPKEDYVYCGIDDYVFSNVNINKFENNNGTVIDKDYIMNNQNEDSNKYVYYTINKDSFSPYYYNTGIRATMNETLSYNQLKDVLYQIAITAEGFSTDSNNKSLTILEGRPIVVRKEKDVYNKKEVENLLDSFEKVDILINEDNEVTQNNLDELISNKDLINIVGDGKDFKIRGFYKDGNYVTVSIQELMGHFGYNVKYDKKKDELIVSKDDFKLILKKSTSNYVLNGKKGKFPTEVKNISGDWYVDFDTIMDIIGYDVKWNEKDLSFKISKNKK